MLATCASCDATLVPVVAAGAALVGVGVVAVVVVASVAHAFRAPHRGQALPLWPTWQLQSLHRHGVGF